MRALVRRFWKWLVSVPLTAYGLFALVRDEFLPSSLRAQLRIGGVIGNLLAEVQWQYWIIAGLSLLLLLTYLPKIRTLRVKLRKPSAAPATATPFRVEGVKLAHGHSMVPTDHAQDYRFTVVNESGIDIPQCYVTLDKSERRVSKQEKWEIEQEQLVDAPFKWNKQGVSEDGRLFIGDGDRASFTLGRSTWYSAMDAQTRQQTGFYQFTLTLHGSGPGARQYELYIGHFYRLLRGIVKCCGSATLGGDPDGFIFDK